MSKASDWLKTHTRPRFVLYDRGGMLMLRDISSAMLTDDGGLSLTTRHSARTSSENTNLTGAEAIAFARWILDTFEDGGA